MLFVLRFSQEAGCIYASMEWTPLQTRGGLCVDVERGRPSIKNTKAIFLRL